MITEKQVRSRAATLYGAMKQRITKKGLALPFARADFADWLWGAMGAQASLCRYCRVPIDALSCSPDHRTPLSRCGDLGLENLDADVCNVCNREKGDLCAEEFAGLVELMQSWHHRGEVILRRRLKDGLALDGQRIQAGRQKRRAQP